MSPVEERVELVAPHTADWAARFARMRRDVMALLPHATVEHIGSTAIPGMPAKDVVDVLIGVPAPELDGAVEELRRAGFDVEGHRPEHAWLSWPDRRARRYVLHVMEDGGTRW